MALKTEHDGIARHYRRSEQINERRTTRQFPARINGQTMIQRLQSRFVCPIRKIRAHQINEPRALLRRIASLQQRVRPNRELTRRFDLRQQVGKQRCNVLDVHGVRSTQQAALIGGALLER